MWDTDFSMLCDYFWHLSFGLFSEDEGTTSGMFCMRFPWRIGDSIGVKSRRKRGTDLIIFPGYAILISIGHPHMMIVQLFYPHIYKLHMQTIEGTPKDVLARKDQALLFFMI